MLPGLVFDFLKLHSYIAKFIQNLNSYPHARTNSTRKNTTPCYALTPVPITIFTH